MSWHYFSSLQWDDVTLEFRSLSKSLFVFSGEPGKAFKICCMLLPSSWLIQEKLSSSGRKRKWYFANFSFFYLFICRLLFLNEHCKSSVSMLLWWLTNQKHLLDCLIFPQPEKYCFCDIWPNTNIVLAISVCLFWQVAKHRQARVTSYS